MNWQVVTKTCNSFLTHAGWALLKKTAGMPLEEHRSAPLAIVSPALQNLLPQDWEKHRFGLTPERWDQVAAHSFWITGAGTGYGRSLACALAAGGAQVFLTGRRVEKLKETLAEMMSLGISTQKAHLVPADLTNKADIEAACQTVRGLCSSLYGLINNAALPSKAGSKYPLHDDPFEYWEKIMATNLTAPWFLTRTIFPHMATGGHVRVVFMSSEAAWASTPGFGMYNISKAALNSLGHSLAQELAAYTRNSDIQINTVVPGEARTEMNQGSNTSPYAVVSMLLLLLSHPDGGPNGRFFHRDGRHLQFAYTEPYTVSLI